MKKPTSNTVCDKQQKVVKKSGVLLRCLNRRCAFHGQEVSDNICQVCPLKVKKHVRPCRPRPTTVAPSEAPREMKSDEEMIKLVNDSPLEVPEGIEEEVPEAPGLRLQLWTYAEAVMKWNSAGRPTRTDDEVGRILETICKPCSWYEPGKKRCRGCGCSVSTSSIAVANKLKMATEKCPRGLWG